MTLLHTLVCGAIIAFLACFWKSWWDLRKEERSIDRDFRDEVRECREEYWSIFVLTPLNSFYTTALDLHSDYSRGYATLEDILLDNEYKPILESYISRAARELETYIRLRNLTTELRLAIESIRKWLFRIILCLFGLFVIILADAINQFLFEANSDYATNPYLPVIISLFCVLLGLVLTICIIYVVKKLKASWNLYHASHQLLTNCEEQIENASEQ